MRAKGHGAAPRDGSEETAITEPANVIGRGYRRAAWVLAAIIAVALALGTLHLIGSVPVFGVKPLEESGEMPKEEHPAAVQE